MNAIFASVIRLRLCRVKTNCQSVVLDRSRHGLSDFQLTQMKIARMAARLAGCRQLTYAIAKRLDTESGRMEASLAKLFACRSAELITREALQIHGGMGYAEEMPVSR